MKIICIKLLFLVCFLLVVSFISSCSSDEKREENRSEYAKIAANRTTQDLLNDLFIGSDGDIESLARILNVTPSTIDRIRKGKSEATPKFENRIREVVIYYYQHDMSYIKLQELLDPEWEWYDTYINDVLTYPSKHPFYFWGCIILIIIMCFIEPVIGVVAIIFTIVAYTVVWLLSLALAPSPMEDKYIDVINPVVEQLI